MTPFKRVKAWVDALALSGVRLPTSLPEILKLNYALIREESEEALESISLLEHDILMMEEVNIRHGIVEIAKELADTIVVCNHLFAQLGIDGDIVTNIVTNNNDKKLTDPSRHLNAIGKIVLSPEAKAELKREVYRDLDSYIGGVYQYMG